MKYNGNLVIRSLLFTAGHNDKYINKAFASDSDVIVFDLEDAVPYNKKEEARKKLKIILEEKINDKRPIFVRINPLETGQTLIDLDSVACENLDGFVYPKAYNADDVKVFSAQLALKERNLGLEDGHFRIIVLIETPEAVHNAYEIAKASPRVEALLFGSEDFLADMEGTHGIGGRSILVPRHLVSMAAKASGILAIDTPYVKVGDMEGLREHIKQARELGFDGMLVMSPRELEIVKELYTPSEKEISEAKEIVRLSEEAIKSNRGIAMYNGVFISPPTLSRAKKTLKKYQDIIDYQNYLEK